MKRVSKCFEKLSFGGGGGVLSVKCKTKWEILKYLALGFVMINSWKL